jgi:hypothetical protein
VYNVYCYFTRASAKAAQAPTPIRNFNFKNKTPNNKQNTNLERSAGACYIRHIAITAGA